LVKQLSGSLFSASHENLVLGVSPKPPGFFKALARSFAAILKKKLGSELPMKLTSIATMSLAPTYPSIRLHPCRA